MMAAIKVYLDEDVHTFIAPALRLRSWEALTTEEAGRRGANDLSDHLRDGSRVRHSDVQ